ncbi:DUF1566 domain-containing protein [Candidatus Electrothrix aarhusensis]
MRLFNRIGLCFAFLLVATGSYVWAANFNPLPDTGQTSCYDADGNEILCPAEGEPFYGQDAQYQGVAPSYTDNGDGTVTDNNTGLMWQKDTSDIDNDNLISSDDTVSWQDAVDYCAGITFAGASDWHLPTRFEISSIIDRTRTSPAINPIFRAVLRFYWADSIYSSNTSNAWGAHFSRGHTYYTSKLQRYYVRCVRTSL